MLCWNGEAWRIRGAEIEEGEGDTREVFEVLLKAPDGRIDEVLGAVDGEFAFVFYDAPRGVCWFGRDWVGRRSMVVKGGGGEIRVASVGDGEVGWSEVDAGGVWRVEIESGDQRWVVKRADGSDVR